MEVLFVNAFILFLATATFSSYYLPLKLSKAQKTSLGKDNLFNDIQNFSPNWTFVSKNNKIGIAIDKNSKQICLVENHTGSFPVELKMVKKLIVSHPNVLKIAIIENGYILTKRSTFNKLLCLIFGRLAAKKTTITKVKNLGLKITINNTQHPLWVIPFLCNETEINTSIYKNALAQVNTLHSLIKLSFKHVEENKFIEQTTQTPNNHAGQQTVSVVKGIEENSENNKKLFVKKPTNTLESKCCSCRNLSLVKKNTAEATTRKQRNLLQIAKQANPEAITILMNRPLQPKGIIGKAIFKNSCLQILLESEQVPDKLAMVAFIRKGIANLEAKSIKTVIIYGRRAGEKFPAWTQELEC